MTQSSTILLGEERNRLVVARGLRLGTERTLEQDFAVFFEAMRSGKVGHIRVDLFERKTQERVGKTDVDRVLQSVIVLMC